MYQIQQRETVKLWTEDDGKRRKTHSKCIKFKGSHFTLIASTTSAESVWWRISIFIVIDMTKMKPMGCVCKEKKNREWWWWFLSSCGKNIEFFITRARHKKKLNHFFSTLTLPVHHINISVVNMNLWRWDVKQNIFSQFLQQQQQWKWQRIRITKLNS